MKPVPDKPKAAFPLHTEFSTQFGMDLRDWFAGMALQGMLAYSATEHSGNYHLNSTTSGTAENAYEYADAMMEQRKRPACQVEGR